MTATVAASVIDLLRTCRKLHTQCHLSPTGVRQVVEYLETVEAELTEVKARLEARTGET